MLYLRYVYSSFLISCLKKLVAFFFVFAISIPLQASLIDSEIELAFKKGASGHAGTKLIISTQNGITSLEANKEHRSCAYCSDTLLLQLARELGASIHAKKNNSTASKINLSKLPPHLSLWLDGFRIAPGSDTLQIEPGTHQFRLIHNKSQSFTARTLQFNDYWRPTLNDFSFRHLYPKLLTAGIIGMGLSAAITASGIALVAIDNSCASTQQLAGGTCVDTHQTRTPGTVLVSIGGAVLISAISILIYRGKKIRQIKKQLLHENRK